MKKVLLFAALFAATVANAQVILWDGEDKEVGSDGGFWNRADPAVVEDNGNKCLKVTLKANPGGWDQEHHNAALPLGETNFKGLRRMTLRMKMNAQHNVLVKLVKDGDGGYNTGRLFWLDNTEDWNILTFEFGAGPESDKITDSGNTVLEIWPFEETAQGEGHTIYIDDIKVEGPMVNDMGVRALADNSLTGDVVVAGVIGKGSYQCTWDGDWHPEAYDDYALLAAKLAADATSLDVRGAGRWDEDWTAIKAKCPNIKIITSDADVTGINEVKGQKEPNSQYFNLGGQRIAQPTKGLYIINGKKVVIK
jgi:hypothetical protein